MAIPDYQSIMLPLMNFAADGAEHSLRETIETLGERFGLTPEERRELLPSGRQPVFDNRVGWARTYLKNAGLVESTRRGHFQITARGQAVLREKPDEINAKFLRRFEEFEAFRLQGRNDDKKEGGGDSESEATNSKETPEEAIEIAYQALREGLANELVQTVMEASPTFFEQMVIDLLVKMGYGGTRKDAGQRLGKSGDGGIDGIIKEDRLGLDTVFIQAKKWEGKVGRPELQKFAGALQGHRARKGVFITTASFTAEAVEYVERIDSKIVLIDGEMMAQLMIDYGIGVATQSIYEVKRVDIDYFAGN